MSLVTLRVGEMNIVDKLRVMGVLVSTSNSQMVIEVEESLTGLFIRKSVLTKGWIRRFVSTETDDL